MNTNRRNWIKGATGLGVMGFAGMDALAVPEAYTRKGSNLSVGLAAYSFRNNFEFMKGKPNKKAEGKELIDMHGFIRFCAENGVAGAELTSYFFPPNADNSHMADCRKEAHLHGVAVSGTAVGNNFSHPKDSQERSDQMNYVKEWIDFATVMGAPHIRVFAGKHPKGVSADDAERNAIEALEEAGQYAGEKGIFLGIENHDSIGTADRLLRIVKAVESPWVGVNLDSGNFHAEDPYAEMEASAPYAVNVQLKTELVIGDKKEKDACDIERVIKILQDANYSGYVVLEYEEEHDPFVHVPPILERMNELCG